MKTSYKKLTQIGTLVFIVNYWFDFDNPYSLTVKVFKSFNSALSFISYLEELGITKYTFSKDYWIGYFNGDGEFVHTDNE